jgi:hypothetical protein
MSGGLSLTVLGVSVIQIWLTRVYCGRWSGFKSLASHSSKEMSAEQKRVSVAFVIILLHKIRHLFDGKHKVAVRARSKAERLSNIAGRGDAITLRKPEA